MTPDAPLKRGAVLKTLGAVLLGVVITLVGAWAVVRLGLAQGVSKPDLIYSDSISISEGTFPGTFFPLSSFGSVLIPMSEVWQSDDTEIINLTRNRIVELLESALTTFQVDLVIGNVGNATAHEILIDLEATGDISHLRVPVGLPQCSGEPTATELMIACDRLGSQKSMSLGFQVEIPTRSAEQAAADAQGLMDGFGGERVLQAVSVARDLDCFTSDILITGIPLTDSEPQDIFGALVTEEDTDATSAVTQGVVVRLAIGSDEVAEARRAPLGVDVDYPAEHRTPLSPDNNEEPYSWVVSRGILEPYLPLEASLGLRFPCEGNP